MSFLQSLARLLLSDRITCASRLLSKTCTPIIASEGIDPNPACGGGEGEKPNSYLLQAHLLWLWVVDSYLAPIMHLSADGRMK